jgi:SAM-dependent methyltransferase
MRFLSGLVDRLLSNPRNFSFYQRLVAGNLILSILEEELKKFRFRNVLELACGSAEYAPLFRDCSYTGIDLNADYIARAKAQNPDKSFLVMDAREINLPLGYFDFVLAIGLFHHLSDENARSVLREIKRVICSPARIMIIDGIWPVNQINMLGYILRKLDRGKYVRSLNQYFCLFNESFKIQKEYVRSRYPIDVAVFILEARSQMEPLPG